MSDIYRITRERVVDIYDTRSIDESVQTFRTLIYKINQKWLIFLLYKNNKRKKIIQFKCFYECRDGIEIIEYIVYNIQLKKGRYYEKKNIRKN